MILNQIEKSTTKFVAATFIGLTNQYDVIIDKHDSAHLVVTALNTSLSNVRAHFENEGLIDNQLNAMRFAISLLEKDLRNNN